MKVRWTALVGLTASTLTVGCASGKSTVLGTELRSRAALEIAAADLECPQDLVRVTDFGDYVQARGCHRLTYFLKKGKNEWVPAGPRFELEAADEVAPEFDTGPVSLYVVRPWIPFSRLKDLTSFTPTATSHCILRADGTLHHCLVMSADPVVSEAVAQALRASRYQPATHQGKPVAIDYISTVDVKAPKPNCAGLISNIERSRCYKTLEALEAALEAQ